MARGFMSDRDGRDHRARDRDEARKSNLVDVEAKYLDESAAAYKVDGGDGVRWLPKSLTEWDGKSTFTMPEWLALDKGLI